MRPTTRTRQELIAVTAVVASTAAAALATYLLLVGPSPSARQTIATVVPSIGGRDPVTVAAVAPTAAVVAGVLLSVLYEATRQVAVAHERRRELEAAALEDLE